MRTQRTDLVHRLLLDRPPPKTELFPPGPAADFLAATQLDRTDLADPRYAQSLARAARTGRRRGHNEREQGFCLADAIPLIPTNLTGHRSGLNRAKGTPALNPL
jgi:hypothetical protein